MKDVGEVHLEAVLCGVGGGGHVFEFGGRAEGGCGGEVEGEVAKGGAVVGVV